MTQEMNLDQKKEGLTFDQLDSVTGGEEKKITYACPFCRKTLYFDTPAEVRAHIKSCERLNGTSV